MDSTVRPAIRRYGMWTFGRKGTHRALLSRIRTKMARLRLNSEIIEHFRNFETYFDHFLITQAILERFWSDSAAFLHPPTQSFEVFQ